jgi:hypothetical protein
MIIPPGANCDADCIDAYLTYLQLVEQLGREPTMKEILYMTAAKEYFAYVDYPYYNSKGYIGNSVESNYPEPSARPVGQEALARAYYHFCYSEKDNCRGTELYRFLSGYEPWCGYAGADNGDPYYRASKLIRGGLYGDLAGTESILRVDIDDILGSTGPWLSGWDSDKPWQWFTTGVKYPLKMATFGTGSGNKAILVVNTGGGQYLWMVTGTQDSLWW